MDDMSSRYWEHVVEWTVRMKERNTNKCVAKSISLIPNYYQHGTKHGNQDTRVYFLQEMCFPKKYYSFQSTYVHYITVYETRQLRGGICNTGSEVLLIYSAYNRQYLNFIVDYVRGAFGDGQTMGCFPHSDQSSYDMG